MEKLVPPTDGHDTRGQVDPSVHGTRGPLAISISGHPLEMDPRVTRAAKELGGDFRPILDMNSGKPIGTSELHSAALTRYRFSNTELIGLNRLASEYGWRRRTKQCSYIILGARLFEPEECACCRQRPCDAYYT